MVSFVGSGHTYEPGKDGRLIVRVDRPSCVFPLCCHAVEPSQMRTLLPEHPIAAGLPETFTLEYTEMYDGPFGVPPADEIIFSESWADGEHFNEAGAIWNVGKGKVFYFRPGHETYRVSYHRHVLKILGNATTYLGRAAQESRSAEKSTEESASK